MPAEKQNPILFFLSLSLSAFVLNFCWESWHGLLFVNHGSLKASVYVPMMVQMALLDALSITGMYLFTSLFAKALIWTSSGRSVTIFFLAGMIIACGVEYLSINVLNLWAYTVFMPVIFGVGLFPLLQLSLTGLLSILVAGRLAAPLR